MTNKFIPAATIAAMLIVLELVAYNGAVKQESGAYSSGGAVSSANVFLANRIGACADCLSALDSGRTITVSPTSRITIELPKALYNEASLAVEPAGVLGQTFGATAGAGDFAKTFEAAALGAATIRFSPAAANGTPFVLTVNVSASSSAKGSASGATDNLVITQSDNGKTIELAKGRHFLLKLGLFNWDISLTPPGIVARVPNILVVRGAQGIYTAAAAGTAKLRATGRPICSGAGQMCPQYAVSFSATLVVK